MCARNTAVRRSLLATIVFLLFASQAQALPFSLACLSDASQAPSIECRLASDGMLADRIDVLATTVAGSTFFGSLAGLPATFEINAGEPGQILFSMTTQTSELEVIASMRNETLRAGMRELVLGHGTSYAERSPVARPVALLLIGSGIAGVGAASRRRRALRCLCRIQGPWTFRKEASSSTPVASLFAQWSNHSTPLRI